MTQIVVIFFNEKKREVAVLEQSLKRLMLQQGSERYEWRAQFSAQVFTPARVSIEIEDAASPTAEFGEPSAEVASDQVVLDPL
jgi:hypothetical protein